MIVQTLTQTKTAFQKASIIDENNFYLDEKYRLLGNDCKHKVYGGQCILRTHNTGNHIVSFDKKVLSLLITNNILTKVLSNSWRMSSR